MTEGASTDPGAPPLRVVLLVDNRVKGDSRVIKSARSAAAAGHDVTILGLGKGTFEIDDIPVRLCSGGPARDTKRPSQRLAARLAGSDSASWENRRTKYASRNQRRIDRANGAADNASQPLSVALHALSSTLQASWVVRRKYYSAGVRLGRYAARPADLPTPWDSLLGRFKFVDERSAWEHLDSSPRAMALAWAGELDALAPDIIHANDYRTLPAALEARARAATTAYPPAVLYDAHEWVQGYDELGPTRHRAAMLIEEQYIREADAVVTVAPAIADKLRAAYHLPETPPVILNAPEVPPGPTPGPRLRQRIGVGPEVPLLVYAGSVGASRDIELCIRSLAQLPGVHLALVVGQPDSGTARGFADLAEQLAVQDRVHFTRYVPQEFVVDFLTDASIGLTPFRHNLNTENSLPTKAREYLLAGVPQVVSDVRTLSAFVAEKHLGEIYQDGDLASFVTAVSTVLGNLSAYQGRLTPALRAAHGWPAQAAVLLETYRHLAPQPRPRDTTTTSPRRAGSGETPQAILPPAPPSARRLVVGPINAAGQGAAWAHAASRLPNTSAINVAIETGSAFAFPASLTLTTAQRTDPQWSARLDEDVVRTRTHVLLESGATLTGAIDAFAVAAAVDDFEGAGLRVGVVAHGSEVRSPRQHAVLHPDSPFRDPNLEWVQELQRRTDTTGPIIEWLGLPTFVSTLDLLDYLPRATWLPVTIDLGPFQPAGPPLADGEVPVVLHAPSNGRLKGSHVIDPLLQRLHDEGVLRYNRVVGVSNRELRSHIAAADVVVDQLGMGLYGVLSCEAMAAGRLVLAEVGDAIRTRTPGGPPPIVEVTAATLEHTVRDLTSGNRAAYRELAGEGPRFVQRHHDGTAAAAALASFLEAPPQQESLT